ASSRTSWSATRSVSSLRWPRPARSRTTTRSGSCASAGWRGPGGGGGTRGLAMAEAARENPGSMAAILGLADEVVEALCAKIANVWPANYNCPGQIVISGQSPSVEECCSEAELQGARRTVKLRVSGAFHSPLVARAAERVRTAIEKAKINDPIAPFMSTVTANIEPAQRMAALLVEQRTAPVKFTQAARELMRQGVRVFVEVGPGNVLTGLLKR